MEGTRAAYKKAKKTQMKNKKKAKISLVNIQAKIQNETLTNRSHTPIQRTTFKDQIICLNGRQDWWVGQSLDHWLCHNLANIDL